MTSPVPIGEKLEKPLSLAFSKQMLRDIDRIASATNNHRADTIRHLLRWAIDTYNARAKADESARAASQ